MVKELEDAPRDEIVVVLDAEAGHGTGPPGASSFDAQVRAAGSLMWAHARRGRHARLEVTTGAGVDAMSVRKSERDWLRALRRSSLSRRDVDAGPETILDQAGAPRQEIGGRHRGAPPALVETLIARAAARQQVSVVHVDAGSSPAADGLRWAATPPSSVSRPPESPS